MDASALLTDLVEATRQGDHRAFRAIVERVSPWIGADCRQIVGSREDARDLAQEVLVKAYFRLRSLDDVVAFEPWLRRVKVNHCLSHLRKLRRLAAFQEFSMDEEEVPETAVAPFDAETIDLAATRERIHAALESMSDTLRIPLVMHDMDGMSYSEIAAALEIGVSAAKMRIQRARLEFRRWWVTDGTPRVPTP